MYNNSDLKDLCTLGYKSESKDVNKLTLEIINKMRDADIYGINVVDDKGVDIGTDFEKRVIKIDVPSKSYIVIDGEEMAGMHLAKWYKGCIRDFIILAVTISDITSGNSMFGDLGMAEEEVDELLNSLYIIKAKVRDEEWTEEKALERQKEFDENLKITVENIKKDREEYIEV